MKFIAGLYIYSYDLRDYLKILSCYNGVHVLLF